MIFYSYYDTVRDCDLGFSQLPAWEPSNAAAGECVETCDRSFLKRDVTALAEIGTS